MLYITSLQNPKIKELRQLKKRSEREESGTYLIEGRRAVLDAIANGVLFECILVEDNFTDKAGKMFEGVHCGQFIQVSPQIIEALSDTSAPEGIIAQAKMPDTTNADFSLLKGLVVLIDHLQDPGNLGTIIRTADAAGASAVLLSHGCADLYNSKTIRSTMGSVFNIPIYKDRVLTNDIKSLQSEGYKVYATASKGENIYESNIAFGAKTAIIIGNEGNGIAEDVFSSADCILSLPMAGKAESVNAAVAAGILIYHITFNTKH